DARAETCVARRACRHDADGKLGVAVEAFVHSRDRTWSASVRSADAFEHRMARVFLEARRREESGAHAPGEERVTPRQARGLREGVHRETARPVEPQLVLRPLESG